MKDVVVYDLLFPGNPVYDAILSSWVKLPFYE